jgi:predicted PhzF superfamily epimerase YddE/YHI9
LQPAQVLAAQRLDNGPVWLGLLLDSPETVLQLTPDHAALARLKAKVGVAAVYPPEESPPLIGRANREARAFMAPTLVASRTALPPEGAGLAWGGPALRPSVSPLSIATADAPDLEVRAFAAPIGVNEDPVTGSLNASLAQWLIADGYLPAPYQASQGVCLGRAGQVYLARDGAGQVWVGGQSVTCIDGQVTL